MKGTFFQKSLEYRLVIEGESWHQGSRLTGTLQVKNHGSESVALDDLHVLLAEGSDRKVKAKAVDAFSVHKAFKAAPAGAKVAPSATSEAYAWELDLDANARITDKAGSLYALYGKGEVPSELGLLQLIVLPRLDYLDFTEVLVNTFRFATKQKTAGKKGSVDVKLSPPSGKDHGSIESLVVSFKMDGEDLETIFTFNTKEIDAMGPGLTFKKGKKAFERTFHPAEYLHSFNQRLNKDAVEKAVDVIFQELQAGRLL